MTSIEIDPGLPHADGADARARCGPAAVSLAVLALAAALLSTPARSQTFIETCGLAGQDAAGTPTSLALTSDGGFVVTGNSDAAGAPGSAVDTWIARFDAAGSLRWSSVVTSPGYDTGSSVRVAGNGDLLVSGLTEAGSPNASAWILRLDDTGAMLWQRHCGALTTALMIDQAMPGQHAIACGQRTDAGVARVWVIRLDAAGTLQWERTIGDSPFALGHSIRATSDGGFVISGDRMDPVQFTRFAWAIKADSTGAVTWQRTYALPGGSYFYDLVPVPDGTGYVAVGDGGGSFPGERAWVVRLDVLGNVMWEKSYGAPGSYVTCRSIVPFPLGGFAMVGDILTTAGPAATSMAWLVGLDDNGDISWQEKFTGGTMSGAGAIEFTSAAGLAVAGHFIATGGMHADLLLMSLDMRGGMPGGCPRLVPTTTSATATRAVVTNTSAVMTNVPSVLLAPGGIAMTTPTTTLVCGAPCAAPAEPARVLVENHGSRLVVDAVNAATAYDAYVDDIGSWYAPSLATGTACRIVSWTDLLDGTLQIDLTLPINAWVVLTSSNACGESSAGTDSFGVERRSVGTWESCPLGP